MAAMGCTGAPGLVPGAASGADPPEDGQIADVGRALASVLWQRERCVGMCPNKERKAASLKEGAHAGLFAAFTVDARIGAGDARGRQPPPYLKGSGEFAAYKRQRRGA